MQRKPPAMLNIGLELDPRALADFSCACPVQLIHGCCHAFLKSYPFEGRELVFSDPPCLGSTRKAPERYRYRHDYEEQDHVELIGILKSLACPVQLSGYRPALHDELLSNWRRLELQVMNQAGVVTEVAWYDFAIDRLHWSRHAGSTPNQRQDIKRKAERWARRCQRCMIAGPAISTVPGVITQSVSPICSAIFSSSWMRTRIAGQDGCCNCW